MPPGNEGDAAIIAAIADNLPAIRELCQKYGVVRLELFGSAATGEFDPSRSDIDFLVEDAPETDLGPWLTDFFARRERLASLLGHPVDLIMSGAPRNPYLIQSINKNRRLLYAA